MLADRFAETEERHRVRIMAEKVNMSSINKENFLQLCAELFSVSIAEDDTLWSLPVLVQSYPISVDTSITSVVFWGVCFLY